MEKTPDKPGSPGPPIELPAPADAEPRPTPGNPAMVEVIIVDDSVPVRERIAACLTAVEGVKVVGEADDVPSGLKLLEQRSPDVLILDLELPGQSGMDLLKIARRRGYASVIIMFSIHDHPKLREKCAELGANYYFHKLGEFEDAAEVCRELATQKRPPPA